MTNSKKLKIIVDILMSILLLFLMAYQVTGAMWHEWCGAAMLILFLIHNILNYRWYKGLFRGRYIPLRIIMTLTNLSCLISMLALMYSGIVMSRHVFAWMPIDGSMSLARMMHMSASYLGFVFMSLHIGFHWRVVTTALSRRSSRQSIVTILLRIIVAATSIYGFNVFTKARLWRYMFLKDMFVYMDYEKEAVLVLLENLSMMVMWAAIAYYVARLLTNRKRRSVYR